MKFSVCVSISDDDGDVTGAFETCSGGHSKSLGNDIGLTLGHAILNIQHKMMFRDIVLRDAVHMFEQVIYDDME